MSCSVDVARVTRPREEAEAAYDRISRWYDLLTASSEWKFTRVALDALEVHEGERVLEVAPGTGRALVELARAVGATGRVDAIDISGGMLALSRERLEGEGLASRVSLEKGDAVGLPYDAGSFDAVFSSFALELFDTPDIPLVLGECLRVLRPGGRLCVVAMSAVGADGLISRLYLWGHRAYPRLVDCRPIFTRRAIEEAGFLVVEDRVLSMWRMPAEIVVGMKSPVQE